MGGTQQRAASTGYEEGRRKAPPMIAIEGSGPVYIMSGGVTFFIQAS